MAKIMDPKTMTIDQRKAALRCREAFLENFNEEKRTAQISFASDTPCLDWWGEKEILRCTPEAMDTSRFDAGVMPILFNHDRDIVVAKPLRIWCEDGRAMAEIEFDITEKAEEVMQQVKRGFIRGVSVGYRVNEWEVVERGVTNAEGIEGPAWIAKRWEAYEASIVTCPADPTVGVGRSMLSEYYIEPEPKSKIKTEERGIEKMENQMTPEMLAKEKEAGIQAERERSAAINALCDKHGIENEQRSKWIADGVTIEEARAAALDIIAKRSQPKPNVIVGDDNALEMRHVYADAVKLRAGFKLEKPMDGADRLRHMTMRDIARDMLRRQGESKVYELDDAELFKRAMTTGGLPTLLNDVTNFSLKEGYAKANTTYQAWAYIGSLPDFRESHIVDVSTEAAPKLIPENGEFTDATMKESKESVRLQTYGRSYSYTRQAFINDDAAVLTTIPMELSRQMAVYINAAAYKALANAKFNSGNTGIAAALSVESLGEAMKLMRLTKDSSGNLLRIIPQTLIVPVALDVKASQLLRSAADPNGAHSGVNNPFAGAFQIVSDPELDAISADAWYLAAAPIYGNGVQVNFLNGNQTPTLEASTQFDTLGWKYRMYHDFGVKSLSTIGIVKNAGK